MGSTTHKRRLARAPRANADPAFRRRLAGAIRSISTFYQGSGHPRLVTSTPPPNPRGGASAYTRGVVMTAAERSHGQPSQPLAADGGALSRVLKHAHLSKESVLRVTGPAGTTAAIWLNRHGYEN